MANSRKSTRKTGNVTQLPGPSGGVDVAEPPEEAQTPFELPTEAATAPPTPPRPPKKTAKAQNGPESDPNFFQRIKSVPIDDWGTRVYLYLYVLEPLCNLKQSGGKTYLNRYSEPVQDEHQIMLEYGSGRYRLMLSQNKVSPEGSNELARYEFEILNAQYPPKIPRTAWINDSRNAKWEALLPKETAPGAATAASTIVDAMKMVSDIRRDVRDEIGEPDEQQSRSSEVLETMRAAKELFGPSATATTAAPPADPFDTAAKIMAMRANDPMTTILMGMVDSANKATEAAREREFKLQEKLFEAKSAQPVQKSFLDSALEIAGNPDKLEPLKKLASAFGFGPGEATGRPGRTTWMDITNNLVSGPAGAQLAQGLGHLLMSVPSMFQSNPANGQQMPHPPPVVLPTIQSGPPQPETPQQQLQRIGTTVTEPMIYEFFLRGATGDVWADRMADLWPKDFKFCKALGAEAIVENYKQTRAWLIVGPREEDFLKFIRQFCAYEPPVEDEGPVPPGNGDDGVVDLETEGANA